jgi:hypothetical protein
MATRGVLENVELRGAVEQERGGLHLPFLYAARHNMPCSLRPAVPLQDVRCGVRQVVYSLRDDG